MKVMSVEEFYGAKPEELGAVSLIGMKDVIIHDDDTLSMTIEAKDCHLNMHGSVQGGIQYLICDTVIGAYFKYKGYNGVGVEGTIHYYRPGRSGDTLTAKIIPRKIGRKTGNFIVELTNQTGKMVAEAFYTTMFNPYE